MGRRDERYIFRIYFLITVHRLYIAPLSECYLLRLQ